ncbi:MAG: hypothetical protein ACRCX8_05050 [Sarcina sp.]
MRKNTVAAIGISLAISVVGIGVSGLAVSNSRNVAIALEQEIESQLIASKSNYDNMVKSAKGMTKISDKYSEEFENIYRCLIDNRHSEEQANEKLNDLLELVYKSNPGLDPSIYTNLENKLGEDRKTFDADQYSTSNKIREYNTYLKKHFIMSNITNRDIID